MAARRPGQAHPKRNTEQGLPPPGQDHPGTSGGQTPRRGSSGANQAAGAAAPWTGSSRDKGRPGAPDWNIRDGTGSRSHRSRDSIVEGHVAGRCPGQEQPGQNKKERPQPPGQNCLGRNNQKEFPPPGPERPWESGGQRRRKHEAQSKVVQRRSQVRRQREGQRRGNVVKQG